MQEISNLNREFDLAEGAVLLLERLQNDLVGLIHRSEPGHTIAAAQYARATEYLQSANHALRKGFLLAGHALARSALECQFVLGAFAQNTVEALAIVRKGYLVGELRSCEWLLDEGHSTMSNGDSITDRLATIPRELSDSRFNEVSIKLKRLAEIAGMINEYRGPYSLLSDRAHAGNIASIAQDQVVEESGTIQIRTSHHDSMKPSDVLIISSIAQNVYQETCRFFRVPGNYDEWNKINTEVDKLHGVKKVKSK